MIAIARGCSDPASRSAAICNNNSLSSLHITDVTVGCPVVIVPVLSNTTVVSLPACCKASPFLIRIPCSAARPTPTIIEMGVARPNAQGHAITKTVIAETIAKLKRGSGPNIVQTTKLIREMMTTTGTKIPATLSTKRPISGLLA